MEQATEAPLKKTPLNARHRASGAKMVPFGGWDMPVEYAGGGVVAEHTAVRTRAGLFDVSHMGEIEIAGKDALAAVQRISSNDAAKLAVGQAQYSGLLTPQGTFVDDLLAYRLAPSHFLLVVNAGNIPKDYAWIAEHIQGVGDAVAVDASSRYALRLEAGMRLHGNDIDETTTAVEADLNWIVGWKKDDFVGAAALRAQKADGAKRKIVGFEMLDRGIARHGYHAFVGDEKAGIVTSGTQTPYLKKAIGMAYLPVEHTAAGAEFDVDIRGRRTRARIVPMPFYKRQK